MGLIQIGASILISLLIGALTRGARTARMYLLLGFSVLAIYWFQPLLPLRSFDFWLPSLSLALVILTWLIISQPGAWRTRQNTVGIFVIAALVTLLDLSRYFLPEPVVTATTPPQFVQYFVFIVVIGLIILITAWFVRQSAWVISITIIFLVLILIVLKTPELSLQTSVLFRTLANRAVENASSTDLRWLGFSYIAFRLIHVLRDKSRSHQFALSGSERDKQLARLP